MKGICRFTRRCNGDLDSGDKNLVEPHTLESVWADVSWWSRGSPPGKAVPSSLDCLLPERAGKSRDNRSPGETEPPACHSVSPFTLWKQIMLCTFSYAFIKLFSPVCLLWWGERPFLHGLIKHPKSSWHHSKARQGGETAAAFQWGKKWEMSPQRTLNKEQQTCLFKNASGNELGCFFRLDGWQRDSSCQRRQESAGELEHADPCKGPASLPRPWGWSDVYLDTSRLSWHISTLGFLVAEGNVLVTPVCFSYRWVLSVPIRPSRENPSVLQPLPGFLLARHSGTSPILRSPRPRLLQEERAEGGR